MKNSAVNLDITNNADGFDISGGTTVRKLTLSGANIAMVGSGTNVYTFPAATCTLASTTSPTFATSITGSYLTASEILITDGSKNIVSAPVATYPSLTELSYVKGLSSAIQTQLGGKAATAQTFYIGTTQVAINRASAALTLAGITLTTPDIGAATGTSLSLTGADLLLGLNTTSATGNPYMSFSQDATRRSYIQHVDTGDNLVMASEYGCISFWPGSAGTEAEEMRVIVGGVGFGGETTPARDVDVLCSTSDGGIQITDGTNFLGFLKRDSSNDSGQMALYDTNALKVNLLGAGVNLFNNGTPARMADGVKIGADSTNNHIDDASSGAGSATLYIGNKTIDTTAVSTLEVKKNIIDSGTLLDKISQLRVVDFNYKKAFDEDDKTQHKGMIAEEFELLLPELVNQPDYQEIPYEYKDDKGNVTEVATKTVGSPHKSIRYKDMIPYLVKAIQELKEEINILKKG